MGFVTVHQEPQYQNYKTSGFSPAVLFRLLLFVIVLGVPIVLVAVDPDSWPLYTTFYEQPVVHYQQVALLNLAVQDGSSISCSTIAAYNRLQGPGFRPALLKTKAEDDNGDRVAERLLVSVNVPLQAHEQVVAATLIVFFSFALQMTTVATLHEVSSSFGSQLLTEGNLRLVQRVALPQTTVDQTLLVCMFMEVDWTQSGKLLPEAKRSQRAATRTGPFRFEVLSDLGTGYRWRSAWVTRTGPWSNSAGVLPVPECLHRAALLLILQIPLVNLSAASLDDFAVQDLFRRNARQNVSTAVDVLSSLWITGPTSTETFHIEATLHIPVMPVWLQTTILHRLSTAGSLFVFWLIPLWMASWLLRRYAFSTGLIPVIRNTEKYSVKMYFTKLKEM